MAKKKTRSHKPATKQKQPSNRIPMWAWAAVLILVLVGGAWMLLSQGGGTTQDLAAEISVAEAYQRFQGGAFVLDVREPEEWESFHIPGTTLIPLGELESRLAEVPKGEEIIVVCRTGNRSQAGRDILLNAGFTSVTSMAGGVTEWQAAGYPTTSGK